MNRTVLFHIGAHKTGTTHLQNTLDDNAEALSKAGCVFINLHHVGAFRKLAIQFRRAAEGADAQVLRTTGREIHDAIAQILSAHADCPSLILSYEGMLGSMSINRVQGIYPAAAVAMRELAAVFAEDSIKIALSIRDYPGFISSSYHYMVRMGSSRTFKRWLSGADLDAFSWSRVIGDAVQAFGGDKVVVWTYEAYARDQGVFYDWLLGQAGAQTPRPESFHIHEGRHNASASAEAVALQRASNRIIATQIAGKRARRALALALNREIEARLPRGAFSEPTTFRESTAAKLNKRYRRDLRVIGKLTPGRGLI